MYTHTQYQRLLTQALLDANTYEEMEAKESEVLRRAEKDEDEVEYGAKVRACVLAKLTS